MQLIVQKLTLPDKYDLSPEAKGLRGDMLITAQEVTSVTTADEQATAVEIGTALQKHIKEVKATRLELAQPLNAACDKLIDIEKDYLAPLLVEKDRIGRLVTGFQEAESRRVAEEERQRQLEIRRLDDERQAAEKKAQKAADKGQEGKQMAAELAAYNAQQAQQEVIRAPLPAAVKAKGAATGRKLRYLVTDIKALYAARPELCTVIEKPSAINAVCFAKEGATALDPDKSIAGLSLYWETSTSFRSR